MNSFIIALIFLISFTSASFDEQISKAFWNYNIASYCSSDKISSWNVPNAIKSKLPNITDIRVYENKGTDNLGYMAYNPDANIITVVFRGTMDTSIMNWLFQNLNFFRTSYAKCDGCSVHQGFLQAYLNINPQNLISDIQALKAKYPTAKIVVSGHSLGGAMAYFGYLDICEALGNVDLLYTYGTPRVGNLAFANYFQGKNCGGDKIRVTHDRDPVPHVPPSLFGFYHGYSEIFYNSDGKPVYCLDAEDRDCSKQYDYTAYNPLDHVDYHGVNQQFLMFSCNSLFGG